MKTMKKVYLAGPLSNGSDPYKWHRIVSQIGPSINWVNPFTSQDGSPSQKEIFERDLQLVRDSDAVLLRRKPDYNLCGASIEGYEAYKNNIPVVVWNEAEDEIPLFLDMISDNSGPSISESVLIIRDIIDE